MTAPTVKKFVQNCVNKRRYTDEWTARAGTQIHLEKNPNLPRLWVYNCNICGGWHMTSKNIGIYWLITREEIFHKQRELA